MTTIRDVARAASVSVTTVSRVVNADPAVHPLLRRQVQETMRRLSYRPNAAARNLRRSRTGTVGVVVSQLQNPAFMSIVEGIERVASQHGVALFFCDTHYSAAEQAAQLERLHSQRVDAIVLQPIGGYQEQIEPLRRAGIPIVVTGNRVADGDLPQVIVDEHAASHAAFRHLLTLGHRRIAFVVRHEAADQATAASANRDRVAAYREAHAEVGVSVDERLIVAAANGAESYRRAHALLTGPNRPTALVCGVHTDAPDLLRAAKHAGLRLPAGLSFITYGESGWTTACEPELTVVRRDFAEYGRMTAELLFALRDGADCERLLYQGCALVIRESCAPPCPDASEGVALP